MHIIMIMIMVLWFRYIYQHQVTVCRYKVGFQWNALRADLTKDSKEQGDYTEKKNTQSSKVSWPKGLLIKHLLERQEDTASFEITSKTWIKSGRDITLLIRSMSYPPPLVSALCHSGLSGSRFIPRPEESPFPKQTINLITVPSAYQHYSSV